MVASLTVSFACLITWVFVISAARHIHTLFILQIYFLYNTTVRIIGLSDYRDNLGLFTNYPYMPFVNNQVFSHVYKHSTFSRSSTSAKTLTIMILQFLF